MEDRQAQLRMQVIHLMSYFKENHKELTSLMSTAGIGLANIGEIVIPLDEYGFDYYQLHKEELYEEIGIKTGCQRVSLIVEGQRYVQQSKDVITKDVGQFTNPGVMNDDTGYYDEEIVEEYEIDEEVDADKAQKIMEQQVNYMRTVNIKDVVDIYLPPHLKEQVLTFKELKDVLEVIYGSSMLEVLESIVSHTMGNKNEESL